jgi:hypothetical protein
VGRQIGQSNRDGTTMAGQSGYGSWDKTTETGQLGQDNLDQTAWVGEPGQNKEYNQDITATLGQQLQESRGQDCWGRIAGTRKLG